MKLFSFIILLGLYTALNKSAQNKDCFDYPQKIKDLHSSDLYDSARWILYNWLGPKKLDGVYYGQMELRFKDVFMRNDSMEIYFLFYARASSATSKNVSTMVARASVAFRKSTQERLWAFNYPFEAFSASLEQGDKQLVSPLTDTAARFLRTHLGILNECYLQLGKRKQVVD